MTECQKIIKISNQTSVRKLIDYVFFQVKDEKRDAMELVAMGTAVHKLITSVEVLRHLLPGLFHKFEFSTATRKVKTSEGEFVDQRLVPILKGNLAFSTSKVDLSAYASPIPEAEFVQLKAKLEERKEAKRKAMEQMRKQDQSSRQLSNNSRSFYSKVYPSSRQGRPFRKNFPWKNAPKHK